MQVLHLGAVGGGLEKRQIGDLFVRHRQVETVTELNQFVVTQFFLAVSRHLALARATHAIAFLGVRQDHRGLPDVASGRSIGRVNFDEVMAPALQAVNLLVGHALGEPGQFVVLAEEGLAVVAAIFRRKGLHLAIDRIGKGPG